MARPKTLETQAVLESTNQLLKRLRDALVGKLLRNPLGDLIDAETVENYDPLMMLWMSAHDPDLDADLRISCLKEAAKYTQPQLKGLEVTGANKGPLEIIIKDREY